MRFKQVGFDTCRLCHEIPRRDSHEAHRNHGCCRRTGKHFQSSRSARGDAFWPRGSVYSRTDAGNQQVVVSQTTFYHTISCNMQWTGWEVQWHPQVNGKENDHRETSRLGLLYSSCTVCLQGSATGESWVLTFWAAIWANTSRSNVNTVGNLDFRGTTSRGPDNLPVCHGVVGETRGDLWASTSGAAQSKRKTEKMVWQGCKEKETAGGRQSLAIATHWNK